MFKYKLKSENGTTIVKSNKNENDTGIKTKSVRKSFIKIRSGVLIVVGLALVGTAGFFVGKHFVSQGNANDSTALDIQQGIENDDAPYLKDEEAGELESGTSGENGSSNDFEVTEEEEELAPNDPNKDHDTSDPLARPSKDSIEIER